MNRRERRAAATRAKVATSAPPADIADLMAAARLAHREGRSAQAEAVCKQIITRDPEHIAGLNLLGVIYQASARHRLAVRTFARAIASDDMDAACHYNIASSYQILQKRADAAAHFKRALALGMSDKVVEAFVLQSSDVAECARRTMQKSNLPATADLLGAREISAIANDIFFRCALQATLLRGVELEFLLTHLRFALLRLACSQELHFATVADDVASTFCALAQQCFINEYVFAQGDSETEDASRMRDMLVEKISAGRRFPTILLAAVAAYFPLHSLPGAKSLLAAGRPQYEADLLAQQVGEPIEEAEDCGAIPALTAIDDATSMQVMQQYEQNPYPRWTLDPGGKTREDVEAAAEQRPLAILIAGCGTGRHVFHVAQQSPQAHILAVDISRPSLAYARRKTREAGLRNIEYAQADILNLAAIGRKFDRIEAIGVLHHLADPLAGWRVLLSLLKPDGTMRIGLYSEAARRSIVAARALIADAGHRPTAGGIRALRQAIIRNRDEPHWKVMLATAEDFYSMSGCRDLFFNVMEHRFTIPRIEAFLTANGLSFLGFQVDLATAEAFERRYPGAQAHTNLGYWDEFEIANPPTFRQMYVFSVRKNDGATPH
jgi:SAM-dependent methyltransferase